MVETLIPFGRNDSRIYIYVFIILFIYYWRREQDHQPGLYDYQESGPSNCSISTPVLEKHSESGYHAAVLSMGNDMIRLPCTSTRAQQKWGAHCRIVEKVHPSESYMPFAGSIHQPGSLVPRESFGRRPLVIECVGPQGDFRRGRPREVLFILWTWNERAAEWKELVRATAANWEWVMVLREPARKALSFGEAEENINLKSFDLADRLVQQIDSAIEWESADVRATVLSVLYTQVAGRLVQQSAPRENLETLHAAAG